MESLIFWLRTERQMVREFVRRRSDYQVKWLMFGPTSRWPTPFDLNTSSPLLMRRATHVLSAMDLLGRTERLPAFAMSLTSLLGVQPQRLLHFKPHNHHPFELDQEDWSWIRSHVVGDEKLYNTSVARTA